MERRGGGGRNLEKGIQGVKRGQFIGGGVNRENPRGGKGGESFSGKRKRHFWAEENGQGSTSEGGFTGRERLIGDE